MTGVYVKVARGGQVAEEELEYLTDGEREEVLKGLNREAVMRYLHVVCRVLVEAELEWYSEKSENGRG